MPQQNKPVATKANKKLAYISSIAVLILFFIGAILITLSTLKDKEDSDSTNSDKQSQTIGQNNISKESKILDRNGNTLFVIDKDDSNDSDKKAPHYVDYVLSELTEIYSDDLKNDEPIETFLSNNGYQIKTAVDLELQESLEQSLKNIDSADFQANIGAKNAASVVMDNKTGEILAMVGSKDYFGQADSENQFVPQFNSTVTKQNLSDTVKPIVYLAFLKTGLPASTALPDYRIDLKQENSSTPYYPQDYSRKYSAFGKYVTLRTALENNLNVPAVAAYNAVGPDNFAATYADLINQDDLKDQIRGPAAAIGGMDVSLLDQTHAYSTLGNGGELHTKKAVIEIVDKNGDTIYKPSDETYLENKTDIHKYVYILNNLISQSEKFNDKALIKEMRSKMDLGLMTGIGSNDSGDSSGIAAIIYNKNISVGFWAGNNCGANLCPLEGSNINSDKFYDDLLNQALENIQGEFGSGKFEMPSSGLQEAEGCEQYDDQKKCINKIREITAIEPHPARIVDDMDW